MQTEDGLNGVFFQNAGIADGLGTAGAFLTGLEDQQHIVVQVGFGCQTAGQFQQNGHVAVMTAGVHLARMPGGIGRTAFLGNGQGIHIRPEGDSVIPAKIKPGTKRIAGGRKHTAGKAFQGLLQIGQGFGQLQFQLGNLMQGVTIGVNLHGKTAS